MKKSYRYLKNLLKLPGMDPRHGLKKNYKNLFCGLKKVVKGEVRFDHLYGKSEYHPLFPDEREPPQTFTHTFAIASVIRNEGRYLQEWIEFHRLVGCTKFFIYDNSSTDDTRKILNFYAEKGVVEWTEWPHISPWLNTQQTAFCHAIYKSRGQVKWLALIDADEYLFSPYPQDFIAFLDKYSDLPALIVYWDMFGTSGHKSRPEGLVTENYTRRLDVDHPKNQYHPPSKSIVQPHEVTAVSNSHCFQTRIWPVIGYDENRNPLTRVSDIHRQKNIRLHHYYTKSLEDWADRMSRTGDSTGYLVNDPKTIKMKRYDDAFEDIHRFEIEDKSCHFLLPALKKKLEKNPIP